jgi:hypothetical protein
VAADVALENEQPTDITRPTTAFTRAEQLTANARAAFWDRSPGRPGLGVPEVEGQRRAEAAPKPRYIALAATSARATRSRHAAADS